MDFLTALALVFNEDGRFRRASWATTDAYIHLVEGHLRLRNGGADHIWDIGEADFFAQDWEEVGDDD